jgi:hypothetical protein
LFVAIVNFYELSVVVARWRTTRVEQLNATRKIRYADALAWFESLVDPRT